MEAPNQGGYELDVADDGTESTLRRWFRLTRSRNFILSPFLRMPPELILKIFAHVIESDSDDDDFWEDGEDDWFPHTGLDDRHYVIPPLLHLTAICHQLREIGTASPQLWSSVDFTVLPIAELFLERCKYNPRILLAKNSEPRRSRADYDPRREAVWVKLEGRTFDNLRSLVFRGTEDEFALRVVGVLKSAPNISLLDIYNSSFNPGEELPLPPIGDPIPSLSTLRIRGFWTNWTSPLLRNLSQLCLDFEPPLVPSEHTSIEAFLTALANCPDLEIIDLIHAGPEPLNGHRDRCDVVVQLRRLRKCSLEFYEPSTVGSILSHIKYPESTKLAVHLPGDEDIDLSETISRALPRRNVQSIQHFRKSTTLTICFFDGLRFYTDNVLFRFQELNMGLGPQRNPLAWTQFASKIVEAVGGDAIATLNIESWKMDLPDGMWEALLHGLPRLERISCDLTGGEDGDPVNPFISVFSRPFEGGLVCPRLQYLGLTEELLTQDASVAALKRALTERDACGRRLKQIGLCGRTAKAGDMLVLEQFRDLVDEVQSDYKR